MHFVLQGTAMGRLGRLSGHRERNLQNQGPRVAAQAMQKTPDSQKMNVGTGRPDKAGPALGTGNPGGQRLDFPMLSFFALLCSGSNLTGCSGMRAHTWSLCSPFQRLTKTKELISMDTSSRDGNCWDSPTPPLHPSPSHLGKQACFNLLTLWRKHGHPRCCQPHSLDKVYSTKQYHSPGWLTWLAQKLPSPHT